MTGRSAPGKSLVDAFEVDLPHAARALGLVGEIPRWVSHLLTPERSAWIERRWDRSTDTFEWLDTDRVTNKKAHHDKSALFDGVDRNVRAELLASLAADAAEEISAVPYALRRIADVAATTKVEALRELDEDLLSQVPGATLRRWTTRLELASADPEREWDRDEIRMAVVNPGSRNWILRVGGIKQPWLRDLVVSVLQVRLLSNSAGTLPPFVLSFTRLSAYLDTRVDRGLTARSLDLSAMDGFARWLHAQPDFTDMTCRSVLEDVSAILSTARAVGIADNHRLPAGFAVQAHHYPKIPVTVRADRGFPDATFRFLMGSDDLLGGRVLDLARAIPTNDFFGEVFVTALHLAANFGRRPDELCTLPASRLRLGEGDGAAELLYDNFKSGRAFVWLPLDARTASFAADWLERLRARYPMTPLDGLALLPAPTQNVGGTRPMGNLILARWFRRWVTLLEEAIVIGRLHVATRATLEDICLIRRRDVDVDGVTIGGEHYAMPPQFLRDLVDYTSDVVNRAMESKYAPDEPGDIPIFGDPLLVPGGGRNTSIGGRVTRITEFKPVRPRRFDALGAGWMEVASKYSSMGIPGGRLGASRISAEALQIRLFRHTYLQHLVNIGTDIFLVQELADHASVQTTIDSYVRVQDEKLREAVDLLAEHRLTTYGFARPGALPLVSLGARDIGTNDCTNPQVLQLGTEGCDFDRMCWKCDHYAADPSNIPDIKAEIRTCSQTLVRLDVEPADDLTPHHVAVLQARRDGWRRMLADLEAHLSRLSDHERERVETAAAIVREFRSRVRAGGLNLGGSGS